ncbi:hypothetical protein LAZ67_6001317 [Cordylochernes scorpioides]|uniref:Uncharacterized protein n=1 Tax=Cordylochernes scorpioides TaxID=51811 RepID=A0ABY6KM92_9ARAC|nr:hypothetical protein LAZ67_6001317 [Cordylochernes scorpioides]
MDVKTRRHLLTVAATSGLGRFFRASNGIRTAYFTTNFYNQLRQEIAVKRSEWAQRHVKLILFHDNARPLVTQSDEAGWMSPQREDSAEDVTRFVALTRKQRHLATEIGLGLPHPPVERMESSGRRPDGQSKFPPTNQRDREVLARGGRVGDTAVPSRQEKSLAGDLRELRPSSINDHDFIQLIEYFSRDREKMFTR